MDQKIRVLLVCIALLLGVAVGQVAGILAIVNGASVAQAFTAGGIAFGATVSLSLLVKDALFQ
ncbi:hypothetical protein ACFPK1_03265 [Actinomycetospora rhizophila]|uniref:Uncharacterized protein n=1 Tax=Actinomycetospora rhizophila TaxID=1416876 RepID=A0ABV9ZA98_9PSEU